MIGHSSYEPNVMAEKLVGLTRSSTLPRMEVATKRIMKILLTWHITNKTDTRRLETEAVKKYQKLLKTVQLCGNLLTGDCQD